MVEKVEKMEEDGGGSYNFQNNCPAKLFHGRRLPSTGRKFTEISIKGPDQAIFNPTVLVDPQSL